MNTLVFRHPGLAALCALLITSGVHGAPPAERWSAEKANQWYAAQPFRIGCNFIPSTAANQRSVRPRGGTVR